MGAAPVLVVLVSLLFPIALLLLAVVSGVLTSLWAVYRLWHDEWSPDLRHAVAGIAHFPHLDVMHRG